MPAVTTDYLTLPRLDVPDAATLPSEWWSRSRPRRRGFEGEGFPVRRAFAGVR